MTDTQLKKAIECCFIQNCRQCKHCPLLFKDNCTEILLTKTVNVVCDRTEKALTELKKLREYRKPQKPIHITIAVYNVLGGPHLKSGVCPSCQHLNSTYLKYSYCEKCGQALDWSEK